MSFSERVLLLNRWHKGFLIDGHKRRLSQKVSFQSVLAVGGMGTGKTSTLVLPNLYTLANEELSFVVTDTSGELYEQSSQYLADKGFNIVTFNLMDVHASERYNPLANLNGIAIKSGDLPITVMDPGKRCNVLMDLMAGKHVFNCLNPFIMLIERGG